MTMAEEIIPVSAVDYQPLDRAQRIADSLRMGAMRTALELALRDLSTLHGLRAHDAAAPGETFAIDAAKTIDAIRTALMQESPAHFSAAAAFIDAGQTLEAMVHIHALMDDARAVSERMPREIDDALNLLNTDLAG